MPILKPTCGHSGQGCRCSLPRGRSADLLRLLVVVVTLASIAFPDARPAITVEGRLPGEYFREDNPPRFGALMSFISTADSAVFLHGRAVTEDFTIAQELRRIMKGFKVPYQNLEKIGLLEGETRWLQYTFRKKSGGGFLYITRRDNWILYLVIFNLKYNRLSRELPFVDRYLRQLKISLARNETN